MTSLMPTPDLPLLHVQKLTADGFDAYGSMMGKPIDLDVQFSAFTSPQSDFWREHLFDPGHAGETEILWVVYRNANKIIESLEAHSLTQQAVVPLTAPIVQIVALSTPTGAPDLDSLRAFYVPVGEGICMRAGCWHATRVIDGEAKCLMLTRRSTTVDLVEHLMTGAPASESVIETIAHYRFHMAEPSSPKG